MNNLLSYCGLVDAKIRASEKDLPVFSTTTTPVTTTFLIQLILKMGFLPEGEGGPQNNVFYQIIAIEADICICCIF